jgi:hypothetical protein
MHDGDRQGESKQGTYLALPRHGVEAGGGGLHHRVEVLPLVTLRLLELPGQGLPNDASKHACTS